MALQFEHLKHRIEFKFVAGTSRGTMTDRDIFIVKIWDDANPDVIGLGEAGPLKGLSIDCLDDFEMLLETTCRCLQGLHMPDSEQEINVLLDSYVLLEAPSVYFAFETALLDLYHGGKRVIFDNDFAAGKQVIDINGLIWMGEYDFMKNQADKKLEEGFRCIKMKIGALDFDTECSLLEYMRSKKDKSQLELRVDANGAFSPDGALDKLKVLSQFDLHSIEQPIKAGQVDEMAKLCEKSPFSIALDEELIGISNPEIKRDLLQHVRPQYIILKPTLVGGLKATAEWIEIAESLDIGWWVTSALESNIGLNAIAQFTAQYPLSMPQGLGTGQLYHNNFNSPLTIVGDQLRYDEAKKWGLNSF